MLLPSRRLLIFGFVLTVCSVAVLAEPAALLVLLACILCCSPLLFSMGC
jgi:hypothetical protein